MRDSSVNWQNILATGFKSSAELLHFLDIPSETHILASEQEFPSRIPKRFAKLMEKGNINDPLLLQVLATTQEMLSAPDFVKDPLHESSTNLIPGLIHKYYGRVLLTVTGVCAINCRYCFRRHFPYQDNNPGRAGWQRALDYIANDTSINEVILSGGDPLLATDTLLSHLFLSLENIPHVETIRIHTRLPIVLPERINDSLLGILKNISSNVVMVIHSNHPNELNQAVADTCSKLKDVGCYLLNQSVLLRGVNDNPHVLARLSRRLYECGVIPYYLHLLDKTQGTKHFEVLIEEASLIYKELQAMLPGYLVPRLAREEPGAKSKTLCGH
ncbi:MAG: EF-P beta-lysylation protein EpmB [Legionellaceae bacterium]|nr:EF-P beta-lysylation protein EpmB [Legionellaceae bacterium]